MWGQLPHHCLRPSSSHAHLLIIIHLHYMSANCVCFNCVCNQWRFVLLESLIFINSLTSRWVKSACLLTMSFCHFSPLRCMDVWCTSSNGKIQKMKMCVPFQWLTTSSIVTIRSGEPSNNGVNPTCQVTELAAAHASQFLIFITLLCGVWHTPGFHPWFVYCYKLFPHLYICTAMTHKSTVPVIN